MPGWTPSLCSRCSMSRPSVTLHHAPAHGHARPKHASFFPEHPFIVQPPGTPGSSPFIPPVCRKVTTTSFPRTGQYKTARRSSMPRSHSKRASPCRQSRSPTLCARPPVSCVLWKSCHVVFKCETDAHAFLAARRLGQPLNPDDPAVAREFSVGELCPVRGWDRDGEREQLPDAEEGAPWRDRAVASGKAHVDDPALLRRGGTPAASGVFRMMGTSRLTRRCRRRSRQSAGPTT